jgi:hypothetical protein
MNNSEERILPVLANAIAALRHAPQWGGVLAFNDYRFKARAGLLSKSGHFHPIDSKVALAP